MSDDEYERMANTSSTSMKGDEAFAKRKAGMDKNSLNESLKDYINQWRDERQKEEEELKRLKDKQAKRKEVRAEQEKAMAQKERRKRRRRITRRRKRRKSKIIVPILVFSNIPNTSLLPYQVTNKI